MATDRRSGWLQPKIEALRPAFCQAAQAVYDAWDQDKNGVDWRYGEGGICDAISESMSAVIQDAIDGPIWSREGSQEGSDHSFLVVTTLREGCFLNIPHWIYETGGGYVWKKKKGVIFREKHVEIDSISEGELQSFLDAWRHDAGDHDTFLDSWGADKTAVNYQLESLTPRPIVFLDLDGVVNTESRLLANRAPAGALTRAVASGDGPAALLATDIDPFLARKLLPLQGRVRFVLSSLRYPRFLLHQINDAFRQRGVDLGIHDVTPRAGMDPRDKENHIHSYVQRMPHGLRCVVVDDNPVAGFPLVRTDADVGITDEQVVQIERSLGLARR
jgi:hypothetical protein